MEAGWVHDGAKSLENDCSLKGARGFLVSGGGYFFSTLVKSKAWQLTPVFLPWESHGQRRLVGHTVHGVAKSWTQLITKCTHTVLGLGTITTRMGFLVLRSTCKNWGEWFPERLGDLAEGSCFLNQGNQLGTDKRRHQGHPSQSLSIENIWLKDVSLN